MHSTTNQPQRIAFEAAISNGQIFRASDIASRAVAFYEDQGDDDNAGFWLCRLAYSFVLQAKYAEANARAKRAAEISTTPLKRCSALYYVAVSQTGVFQTTRALITIGQIEEIIRFYPEELGMKAKLKEVNAVTLFRIGNIDDALAGWETAADLQGRNGKQRHAALCCNNLGYSLLQQSKLKEAERWLLQGLELLEKQPHRHTNAGIFDSLGHAYTLMGRYDEAQRHLDRAAHIFEAISDKSQVTGTLLHRSLLYERKHDWKAAQEEVRRALQIATDIQLEHLRQQAQQRLANIEVPRYKATDSFSPFYGMVFKSEAMKTVVARLKIIAATDETVLILGETGTGKDLAARALHHESRRHHRPFVPFNCSTLSRELIESRLFGHRRGAFTGADRDDPGVIRAAAGGTVFLDEIGDLPFDVQGALLRFLQSGEVQPVGASLPVVSDTRVIAATNRDLLAEVAAGRFRKDLYYRLSGVTLNLPPLRQRSDDVRGLAEHFIRSYCERFSLPEPLLMEAEMARLVKHDWPGNVREFENYIKQRVLFGETPLLQAAETAKASTAWRELSEVEKQRRLIEALDQTNGHISQAAQQLGISRRTIQKLRKKWSAEVENSI